MDSTKPHILVSEVTDFFASKGIQAKNIIALPGGDTSMAFSYVGASEKEWIVRFCDTGHFGKDAYAGTVFSVNAIPIPPIVEIGLYTDMLDYAISPKMPGTSVESCGKDAFVTYFETAMEMLCAVNATDLSVSNGYGAWNGDGNAPHQTWKDYLRASFESVDWKILQENEFSKDDYELVVRAYEVLQSLLRYCPETRQLIHGDYGLGNTFILDGAVSAVIDWDLSKYGDFLYDISWIEYQLSLDLRSKFLTFYARKNMKLPHFEERMLAYQLHLLLLDIHFYASKGFQSSYEKARTALLERI